MLLIKNNRKISGASHSFVLYLDCVASSRAETIAGQKVSQEDKVVKLRT